MPFLNEYCRKHGFSNVHKQPNSLAKMIQEVDREQNRNLRKVWSKAKSANVAVELNFAMSQIQKT